MAEPNQAPQLYDQLLALARRLEDDKSFMASVLKQYREQKQLTEAVLAMQLESTPEMVIRLSLCKRPDHLSPQFAEQLQQLADYTGISTDHLSALLRHILD